MAQVDEWRLPASLRKHRLAQRLSLRALGNALGVSHSAIADWEHARSYPSSYEVQRLADALDVTICELYGVEEHATGSGKTDRFLAGVMRKMQAEADWEFLATIATSLEHYRTRLRAEEGLPSP
jgi:transcriptional regulator with XRE-family HTH domain